jgi:DNA primase
MANKVYTQFQVELVMRKIGLVGNIHNGVGKYKCPLPSHRDKTPSFFVNYNTFGYNCFGCHAHGNVFSLVKELTGKSFDEKLNSESFDTLLNKVDDKPIEVKMETAVEVSGTILPWKLSPEAKAYTRKRGIPDQIAQDMEMGYLEDGTVNGTRFVSRLTIPTYNEKGILINIEGRDTTFKATPKVLYPKGAIKPVYQHFILDQVQPLYLVEGLVKLAVLRSDGFFKNSSATLGSYISPYQEYQLKKFNNVVCILDNDDAGEDFYKRIKELLNPLEKRVSCIRLKDKNLKDVDQIVSVLNMSVKDYRESGKMEFSSLL